MQNIPVNDDKYQKLSEQANAAGFADVSAFVEAVADQKVYVDSVTDDELTASLETIRRSEADIKAGRFRDMREAMLEIGQELGFTLPK